MDAYGIVDRVACAEAAGERAGESSRATRASIERMSSSEARGVRPMLWGWLAHRYLPGRIGQPGG